MPQPPQIPDPALPSTTYPGLLLGPSSKYASGPGTHVHDAQIVASLVGAPTLLPSTSASQKALITIPRLLPSPLHASTPSPHISTTNSIPHINSLVLARVLRVRPRQIDLSILCVSPPPQDLPQQQDRTYSYFYDGSIYNVNSHAYPATLRTVDIRATEKDKIDPKELFRAGDIVRARMIAVGDAGGWFVSTARNELGVLVARSERSGVVMVPGGWSEFWELGEGEEGTVVVKREGRKVAKPF